MIKKTPYPTMTAEEARSKASYVSKKSSDIGFSFEAIDFKGKKAGKTFATGDIPPISNTGGNSQIKRNPLTMDTLSVTAKFDDFPQTKPFHVTDDDVVNKLNIYLQKALGLSISGHANGGMNGYKNAHQLEYSDGRPHKSLGFFAWGGNAATYQLYLTSEACDYIQMIERMPKLKSFLEYLQAKVKRLDIAYDDFEGEQNVHDAIRMYEDGQFRITRNPMLNQVGDWVTPDAEEKRGRTVYVGNRKNGKLLRVYEKGKQLGDSLSPWVRWELELKAVDRVIPIDALLNLPAFFTGAYPALKEFVTGCAQEVIKTIKKTAKIQKEKLIDFASTAYGKLINVLSEKYSPDELVELLKRDGVPRRLILPIPKPSTVVKDEQVIDTGIFKRDGLLFT